MEKPVKSSSSANRGRNGWEEAPDTDTGRGRVTSPVKEEEEDGTDRGMEFSSRSRSGGQSTDRSVEDTAGTLDICISTPVPVPVPLPTVRADTLHWDWDGRGWIEEEEEEWREGRSKGRDGFSPMRGAEWDREGDVLLLSLGDTETDTDTEAEVEADRLLSLSLPLQLLLTTLTLTLAPALAAWHVPVPVPGYVSESRSSSATHRDSEEEETLTGRREWDRGGCADRERD